MCTFSKMSDSSLKKGKEAKRGGKEISSEVVLTIQLKDRDGFKQENDYSPTAKGVNVKKTVLAALCMRLCMTDRGQQTVKDDTQGYSLNNTVNGGVIH